MEQFSDYGEDMGAEEQYSGFVINDDMQADWAVRKIQQARETRERLTEHFKYQIAKAESECMREETFFSELLRDYLEKVPARTTKTQRSWELPSGKITEKQQHPEYKRDEASLVKWLEANDYTDYVAYKPSPRWAEFKALTTDVDGTVVVRDTGEVVEGVIAVEREPKFTVEVR